MVKKKTSPAKSRKTSTKSSGSKQSGTKTKTGKKTPPKKSAKKSTDEKSSPTKRVRGDSSLSTKKKSTKTTKQQTRDTKQATKKSTKKSTPDKSPKKAPKKAAKAGAKARGKQTVATGRKKSAAATEPRKLGRKKSAATIQAPKARRRKLAAGKLPAKSGAGKSRAKAPAPAKAPTRARVTAQQLRAKLLASVQKQRAEQEAAAKWQRPKPPVQQKPHTLATTKRKTRVFVVQAGDAKGFLEGGIEPVKRRVKVSSRGNKQIKDFSKVFEGAFNASLKSTPFEDADDAPITRYGVSFRVPNINNMRLAQNSMREWLNAKLPPHASAHLVPGDTSLTVHLNFGRYDDYSTASDAIDDLKAKRRFIVDTMDKTRDFTDYTDDYTWYAEWDWDDDITNY